LGQTFSIFPFGVILSGEELINRLFFYSNLEFINFIFINNMSTKMALFIPIRYLHTQNKEENSKYVNRPKWMDFSVKVYDNIDNKINRDSILDENKGKSGIYL
jgi:hypothetical protein